MIRSTRSKLVRTIVVGPHSDDVSISLHKAKRALPRPQLLLTIFSVSRHKGPAYTAHPDEDIASTRQLEDRRYAAREGMAYLGLGFLDSPNAAQDAGECQAALVRAVEQRLSNLVNALGPEFLLAPLPYPNGRRRHVHHGVAFQAALETTTRSSGPTLILYDDVVYGRAPVNAVIRCRGVDYIPYAVPLSPKDVGRKMDAVGVYQSQTPARFAEAVTRPAPGDHLARPSEVLRIPRHIGIPGLEEYSFSVRDPLICKLLEPFPRAMEAWAHREQRPTLAPCRESVRAV